MSNSTILIPQSRLFPEIIDLIIDQCHSDRQLLQTCSLVCRSWLPTARYHLFSKTKLTARNVTHFAILLSSPFTTLPRFVRILEILQGIDCNERDWLNSVIRTLTSTHITTSLPASCPSPARPSPLPVLPKLHIQSVTISAADTKLSSRTREVLSTSFRELTRLMLVDASFRSFSEFQELVSSFPLLEVLSIQATWTRSHQHQQREHRPSVFPLSLFHNNNDAYVPAPTLRELELATCQNEDVLDWFASSSILPQIRTLKVGHIIQEEVPAIMRFIQMVSESLEHLTLQPERQVQDTIAQVLDLTPNHSLRTLIIDASHCNEPSATRYINTLLSQLSTSCCPSLQTFEVLTPFTAPPGVSRTSSSSSVNGSNPSDLSTLPDRDLTEAGKKSVWTPIDDTLAGFPSLNHVVIHSRKVKQNHPQANLNSLELYPLLQCWNKGIVEFKVIKSPLF